MDVKCPHCGQELEITEELYGKTAPCPVCGQDIVLPNPRIKPAIASSTSINVNVDIKRKASPLGIAALILGIIACLTCWIPVVGLFTIPLAVIGIILSIIGLIMAIVSKKAGFAFPVSGGIVCIISIVIAIVSSGTFAVAVDNAITEVEESINETKQTVVKTEPEPVQAVSSSEEVEPPASTTDDKDVEVKEQWASAYNVVQQGDLQLKIESCRITRPEINDWGERKQAVEEALVIKIRLINTSSGKKIDYRTWREHEFSSGNSKLKDNFDNSYRRIGYGYTTKPVGGVSNESIYPGKSIEDILIFEKPVGAVEWLHLELPCGHFGGEGFFRLEIPASMLRSNPQSTAVSPEKKKETPAKFTASPGEQSGFSVDSKPVLNQYCKDTLVKLRNLTNQSADLEVVADIYKHKDKFDNADIEELFTQFTITTCLVYDRVDVFKKNFANLPQAETVLAASTAVCEECGGTGIIVKACPDCDRQNQLYGYQGGGTIGNGKCKKCGGTGKLARGLKSESASGWGRSMQQQVQCYSCHGTGKCQTCGGTGKIKVKCPACNGRGKWLDKIKVKALYSNLYAQLIQKLEQ